MIKGEVDYPFRQPPSQTNCRPFFFHCPFILFCLFLQVCQEPPELPGHGQRTTSHYLGQCHVESSAILIQTEREKGNKESEKGQGT
jgi:hypothetical protein